MLTMNSRSVTIELLQVYVTKMSRVLTLSPTKRSTVKLEYHFPGYAGAKLASAHLSLPANSSLASCAQVEYGLYFVLDNGDQCLLGKFSQNNCTTKLEFSSYSDFSLKLLPIDTSNGNEVEHDSELSKDLSDLNAKSVSMTILCHPIEKLSHNVQMFTYMETYKLSSHANAVTVDSQLQNYEVYLEKIFLSQIGNYSQNLSAFLYVLLPDMQEKFCVGEIKSGLLSSNIGVLVPKGATIEVKVQNPENLRQEISGNHYDSESNISSSGALSDSETSFAETEIKLLFIVSNNSGNVSSNRYLILKNYQSNAIDFCPETEESFRVTKLALAFQENESLNAKCYLKATLNAKFGTILTEVRKAKPFAFIDEEFCSSISLGLCCPEDFELSDMREPINGIVFYEVKPTKTTETFESCLTCKDVDKLFSTFLKIRDKFSADVAYMRENCLFGCDTLIIGDSILRYVDPSLLNGNVYVQSLGGCTIEQLDYIITVLSLENLKRLIVHIGVNNTHGFNNICNVSEQAEKYRALVKKCKLRAPNAKLYLSGIVARFDKTYCNQWVSNLNNEIVRLCNEDPSLTFINNRSVAYDFQGQKIGPNYTHDNLHISEKGTRVLLCSINSVTKISDFLPDLVETASSNDSYVTAIDDSISSTTSRNNSSAVFQQTYFYQMGDNKNKNASAKTFESGNKTTSTPGNHNQMSKKNRKKNKQKQRLGWGELDVLGSGWSNSTSAISSAAEDEPKLSCEGVAASTGVVHSAGDSVVVSTVAEPVVNDIEETETKNIQEPIADLLSFEEATTPVQPMTESVENLSLSQEDLLDSEDKSEVSSVANDTETGSEIMPTGGSEKGAKKKGGKRSATKRSNSDLGQNGMRIAGTFLDWYWLNNSGGASSNTTI
ncbi:uncharacterized protein LOC142342699 isoform X2 [Convolutriloba macropyga]|uniref:uncharacterized protein LOC142342699 isoform X2 n=1 Tax=Convolutriloba macropyga TaxID=536237 RepID=UPI003F51C35B